MTSSSALAFGRYLRTLRQRRGLILQEVEDRALAAGHRIDKGTVSRLERGRQRISVPALLPLGRIYGVPFDALLERLELDHDAERLESDPAADRTDDDGDDYEALARRARQALFRRSRKLEAYACFRDAQQALRDGRARAPDEARDRAIAALNLGTVARSLGKNHYASHELSELLSAATLEGGLAAMALDRLGNCHRCLGHYGRAERTLEEAALAATEAGDVGVLAYVHYSRGALEQARGEWRRALERLDLAHRAHRSAAPGDGAARPNPTFEVEVLLKMADAHLKLDEPESSGQLALAARRLAFKRGYEAGLGYAELQLGEVQAATGRVETALEHWARAVELGQRIGNSRLGFLAELERFRSLDGNGSNRLARASRRRLERLLPWCPNHLREVIEFRGLANVTEPARPVRPPSASRKPSPDSPA